MINGLALVCLRVPDHQQALDFYVGKLGFEVNTDVQHDGFRYLVINAPRQPEVPIMLVVPGPPVMDEDTAATVKSMIATGLYSVGALATDDCRASYAELKAKGVEFTEEPEERFYGVDASFRDPFGNHWRLTQRKTP